MAASLPDLADLQAFCRVVDLGSVTRAAADLGETKGSVSRRLARVEERLGGALLQRRGRVLVPTEQGLHFRQQAGEALAQLERAIDSTRSAAGEVAGHLRVTAPLGVGPLVLGPWLATFGRRYPEITLELIITDQVLSFERDNLDVALRLSASLPDSTLRARRLFSLDGWLGAAPSYLDQAGRPEHPQELASHRLLLPPLRGTATPLRFVREGERAAEGEEITVVVHGRLLAHDLLLLRSAAVDGAGIAMLPGPSAHLAPGLERVLPSWRLANQVGLWVLSAGGVLPRKTRVFLDFLQEHVVGVDCPTRVAAPVDGRADALPGAGAGR